MNASDKPIILAFIGNYLPGYKAGGILRVTVNTVDYLCDEFEFRIVTRDRDLGDDQPYPDIQINQWQPVGNAMVYYLPPQSERVSDILRLITETPHHILYLNSFFDPFTVKALLNRKFHGKMFKPVVVAPWGEFSWANLRQKYLKKLVFIQAARLFGLYKNVTWRASSEFEKSDIIKGMKIASDTIQIADDFPLKNIPDIAPGLNFKSSTDREGLRLVFFARISREKNLDYALRVLKKVKARVAFDIYGTTENEEYWRECQELIDQLPSNITVKFLGSVRPTNGGIVHIFSHYDLFLYPTGGDAYAHVIAECLISGTPVLVSTETPWRNLEAEGLGWDVDLARMDSFVGIVEKMAELGDDDLLKMRATVRTSIVKRLSNPRVLETNRQLFKKQLSN